MANCVYSNTGGWAGPYSKFRVVAQLWATDTGSGYRLTLRRYVEVSAGTNGFQGTNLTITWGSGSVQLYKNGNYAVNDVDLGVKSYGSSYSLGGIKGYYSGSNYYESSTSVSYTVPKPKYTISYNANGGEGAPGSQTKTYGVTLRLSTTVPTRKNFSFLGWSTNSGALEPTYQPGQNFTTNANTTLYAVWKKSTGVSLKVDGVYKKGIAYIKDNGAYKQGEVYEKIDGIYKRGV